LSIGIYWFRGRHSSAHFAKALNASPFEMTLLRACHWVMRKRHANVNKPGGAESRSFYQRTCIPQKTYHLHPFAPRKNSHLIAIDQPLTSKIIICQPLTSDIPSGNLT
jgi:hypothetical protein